jgi:ElaB/YqjD/DUF883 family membrane-anchored ribosome-binding protein
MGIAAIPRRGVNTSAMDEHTRTIENGNSTGTPFGDPAGFDELEKTVVSTVEAATRAIRKYPLQSVALGLALGVVAGALLKSGRPSGK